MTTSTWSNNHSCIETGEKVHRCYSYLLACVWPDDKRSLPGNEPQCCPSHFGSCSCSEFCMGPCCQVLGARCLSPTPQHTTRSTLTPITAAVRLLSKCCCPIAIPPRKKDRQILTQLSTAVLVSQRILLHKRRRLQLLRAALMAAKTQVMHLQQRPWPQKHHTTHTQQ